MTQRQWKYAYYIGFVLIAIFPFVGNMAVGLTIGTIGGIMVLVSSLRRQ